MLKNRPEIDGLRAVAVLPVILFHAGFSSFSGGFIGVDVFFVISGYLITTIIVEERRAGKFTLLGFYERRARRILPALYFVIFCCLPFAWLWMTPDQAELFGFSVIAVSLFAANILFWRQTGYFAGPAEEMPLLHTWSLAVEEQFYLIFPIFVLLAWRIGLRNLAISIGILAAISLGIAEWGWRFKPIANFYLLPTRAWELLVGSMAAIYLVRRPMSFGHWNQPASLGGLGLILYAVVVFDSGTPFPSLLTLVPVVGAVLIILFATPETLVSRLLSLAPFVGIGLISYSAYLWHQPLFAFARLRSIDEPDTSLMLALVALALSLAWASWHFVENPFRDKVRISRIRIFTVAPLTAMLLIAIGLFGADRGRLGSGLISTGPYPD
ncbi:MAG: acyltransferase [Parvibaculum sp.]|uniref:acyltransferase family protein n=1 Tax=Parvibaculum sp. TaxID=2024848 RepID=UPI00271EB964|nr:acyltransferase [Parvibaculum sp.]MDO8837371.1 acyltransferase [Parvibaculum sp.]